MKTIVATLHHLLFSFMTTTLHGWQSFYGSICHTVQLMMFNALSSFFRQPPAKPTFTSSRINESIVLPRRHHRYVDKHVNHRRRGNHSYIQTVPNEILIMIFEFLAVHDKATLTSGAQVCSRWYTLIMPILWRTVIIKHSRQRCGYLGHVKCLKRVFTNHVRKNGSFIRSLVLAHAGPFVSDGLITQVAIHCPNLTVLNLAQSWLITDEVLQVLSQSPCAPKLRILNLARCYNITDEGLTALSKTCTSLETLMLNGCFNVTDTGVIRLVHASSQTLRRLQLNGCNRITGKTVHEIAVACHLHLQWLDLARIKSIQHSDIETLVHHCPNITHLNIAKHTPVLVRRLREAFSAQSSSADHRHSRRHTVSFLSAMQLTSDYHTYSELLERLQSDYAKTDVSKETITVISQHLPKLEYLDVSNWIFLSDSSLLQLLRNVRTLRYLNLIGCHCSQRLINHLSHLSKKTMRLSCVTVGNMNLLVGKKNEIRRGWDNSITHGASETVVLGSLER
ncbi:uncharacterized protein BYT42DRAFT_575750 [Radiomyces spectabilis]|uniref:uncharacterized protein n=1 Tax=Radiomyces spectabilis TaxID=64574 RepID=UPI002220BAE4|nr:uncharacterized protein BYT42DRAFT_575750 [Radiomyces spectabilis]KAI8374265.1 hypothetical protein BYT42DRAFT_575750 [Radiomyces spectabilis]